MLIADPRLLLRKLNGTCTKALEAAASHCVSQRQYEVTPEHLLLALLDDAESDVASAFAHYQIDVVTTRATLQRYVGDLRKGNAGKPVFSVLLFEWIQDSWVYASTELGEATLRSGALLVRLVLAPSRYLPF